MSSIDTVRKHFDAIAGQYDYYKRKNWYYYQHLKALYAHFIPPGQRVLEIGCGTGDLLAAVQPSKGVGVDSSGQMLALARVKHPDLEFVEAPIEELSIKQSFDYVIMADVVDHITDLWLAFRALRRVSSLGTTVVISSVNPVWTLPLDIAEHFNLKMPEGPHNWAEAEELEALLALNDFEVFERGYRLPIPKHFPFLSDFLNHWFERMLFFRNLGVVQYLVVKPRTPFKQPQKLRASVVIPCLNEEGNIAACIQRVPSFVGGTEIIVVDDGSIDGTAAAVKALAKKDKRVKLVSLPSNRGKGAATKAGFGAATGDILMILDADMSVPPEDLQKFYDVLAEDRAGFVNGTRLVYPVEEQAMRSMHILGNKVFSVIFSWLLGQSISDTLCGTKAFFRRDLGKFTLKERAWPDFDLLFGASKAGLRIVEMPVRYKPRVSGEAKMRTFKHGFMLLMECFKGFFELKLKR